MAKILVIDDDPAIGMIIQIALTMDGHEVVVRTDALDGLALMQNDAIPDLVLTDLIMGIMNGRDFIQKMRLDPRLSSIPTVVITGCIPQPGILPETNQYQGLLIKPFCIEDLISTVARLTTKADSYCRSPVAV